MRRAAPLTINDHLHLTSRRFKAIRVALRAWMDYDPIQHWADAFDQPAVEVLGALLTDPDVMADFLSNYYRGSTFSLSLKERQVQYVVLRWLVEFACGFGQ